MGVRYNICNEDGTIRTAVRCFKQCVLKTI